MPLAPLHPDFAARATLIAEQVRAAHCDFGRAVRLIQVSLASAYAQGGVAATTMTKAGLERIYAGERQ